MSIDRRDLASALGKKGFASDGSEKNKDHDFFYFVVDGRKSQVYTKLSRGTDYKTLGNGIVAKIAKQMRLSKKELHTFVECSLTKEGYAQKLYDLGVIPQPATPPDATTPRNSR